MIKKFTNYNKLFLFGLRDKYPKQLLELLIAAPKTSGKFYVHVPKIVPHFGQTAHNKE